MATITLKKDEPEAPVDDRVSITLNLAPAAGGGIVHAGVMYVDRGTYKVSKEVARDLLEIQNRGLAHEASLRQSENGLRRQSRSFV